MKLRTLPPRRSAGIRSVRWMLRLAMVPPQAVRPQAPGPLPLPRAVGRLVGLMPLEPVWRRAPAAWMARALRLAVRETHPPRRLARLRPPAGPDNRRARAGPPHRPRWFVLPTSHWADSAAVRPTSPPPAALRLVRGSKPACNSPALVRQGRREHQALPRAPEPASRQRQAWKKAQPPEDLPAEPVRPAPVRPVGELPGLPMPGLIPAPVFRAPVVRAPPRETACRPRPYHRLRPPCPSHPYPLCRWISRPPHRLSWKLSRRTRTCPHAQRPSPPTPPSRVRTFAWH